jgi:hypothetical protein
MCNRCLRAFCVHCGANWMLHKGGALPDRCDHCGSMLDGGNLALQVAPPPRTIHYPFRDEEWKDEPDVHSRETDRD